MIDLVGGTGGGRTGGATAHAHEQAAIYAVDSDAATAADTDWRQVVALYDQLLALAPSPVVALNRAVAVAERDGPAAALPLLDDLGLEHYHLLHAARADLLARLGRVEETAAADEAAAGVATNQAAALPAATA